MARPVTTMVQMQHWNPGASAPLILPVQVICNTPDDELERNVRANAERQLPWIGFRKPNDSVAVMVGGGPSMAEYVDEIRRLSEDGAVVFAMNAASKYLTERGITVDYQVIADAKPETATLVDPESRLQLIASQVNPATLERAPCALLWHLAIDEQMDRLFPPARAATGGYALVGGGAAVGNAAMCLAYVMGYRTFEVFGYDSSHRGDASHAYDQPMNRFIPTTVVEWADVEYVSSVAMKAQAEKFQITGQALRREGCTINVHGDGLLPAMWNTPAENLTERDKYRLMWSTESYRECSPGEMAVPLILEQLKPDSLVLDFGCGTGRASLELAKRGVEVLLIDFADNCRDEEAMHLPFLEWDLTRPLPPRAKYGICTDVMEHIPTDDVETVLMNILSAAELVFFQISTVQDHWGGMIDSVLHLTVQPHEWWRDMLGQFGSVEWSLDCGTASVFTVRSNLQ